MEEQKSRIAKGNKPLLRPHSILRIIRIIGLEKACVAFALQFLIASALLSVAEPGISSFFDGLWVMFQVITTIGFGDYPCVTILGRCIVMLLSFQAVFFLALITGAVVSYVNERMNAMRDASVAHFIDQLERLPELSDEELIRLSNKIKELHKKA